MRYDLEPVELKNMKIGPHHSRSEVLGPYTRWAGFRSGTAYEEIAATFRRVAAVDCNLVR
jgi:hypothetical protein